MIVLRLTCSAFWVDVRLRGINGRWIASADTPDGPSLGLGELALEAIDQAFGPFDGIVNELLASVPHARIEQGERTKPTAESVPGEGSIRGRLRVQP